MNIQTHSFTSAWSGFWFKAVFPAVLFLAAAGCRTHDVKEILYVGTFSGEGSQGIYVFEFDRESLHFELLQTLPDRESPSFQALHPGRFVLYSASRSPFTPGSEYHTIGSYLIDKQTGMLSLLNEQPVLGRGPAHVSVDPLGEFVYVSNYGSGNLSVFRVNEDGSLTEPVDMIRHEGGSVHPRQQNPHVHAIDPSPDGRFIYVSDLGLDRIMIYEINRNSGKLEPAPSPWFANHPGSGPRHFTFHPGGAYAYSVEELSSTVAVLRVDRATGGLEQIQRLPMLPDYFEGANTAADIHTSPDGRFLYASNRGHDSLVIYAIDPETGLLTLAGHEPVRGGHPRNFWVDPEGEFVLVANRDDDHVVVFRRDRSTGKLDFTGTEITVPRAVCISRRLIP